MASLESYDCFLTLLYEIIALKERRGIVEIIAKMRTTIANEEVVCPYERFRKYRCKPEVHTYLRLPHFWPISPHLIINQYERLNLQLPHCGVKSLYLYHCLRSDIDFQGHTCYCHAVVRKIVVFTSLSRFICNLRGKMSFRRGLLHGRTQHHWYTGFYGDWMN